MAGHPRLANCEHGTAMKTSFENPVSGVGLSAIEQLVEWTEAGGVCTAACH